MYIYIYIYIYIYMCVCMYVCILGSLAEVACLSWTYENWWLYQESTNRQQDIEVMMCRCSEYFIKIKKVLDGSPVSLHFTLQPVPIIHIYSILQWFSRFTSNLSWTTSFVIFYPLFHKYLNHVSWCSVIRRRMVWISAESLTVFAIFLGLSK